MRLVVSHSHYRFLSPALCAMPCATSLHLPGRRRAISMGLKTENWWTPRWQDKTMVDGYQVCGFSSWYCLTDSSGGQILVSLWALVPAASFLLASTGIFDSKICSLSDLPPGSQGLVPPKWTGRPRATALTAASWAHIRPRLCCLAASCRIRARPFAPVPRLWVWVFPPFGHARTRALVAAPQVWLVDFALALPWQCLWRWLVHAPAFSQRLDFRAPAFPQRLDFAPCLALHPGCQRLGLSGSGSLSLASGFDAGGFLGQDGCSACDR